jgi:hypothetical protein
MKFSILLVCVEYIVVVGTSEDIVVQVVIAVEVGFVGGLNAGFVSSSNRPKENPKHTFKYNSDFFVRGFPMW